MNLQPWHENIRKPVRHEPVSVALIGSDASQSPAEMLKPWSEFLRAHHPRHELLLIDDGGKLDALSLESIPSLRLIHHPRPLGPGGVLQTAIFAARHPLLLAVRADRRFDPSEAYRLFNSIDHGDLIVGHRVSGQAPYVIQLADGVRSWLSRLFLGNFLEARTSWLGWAAWRRQGLHRWIFGVPVLDGESGIFLARRSIFDRIPIQSNSYFCFVEALAKANHVGFMLGEEPIRWTPTAAADPISPSIEMRTLFRFPLFRSVRAHDLPTTLAATES